MAEENEEQQNVPESQEVLDEREIRGEATDLSSAAADGKAQAKKIGKNLDEIREKKGFDLEKLAKPEFSQEYIRRIIRGKIRPSRKAIKILADRLDVPPETIDENYTPPKE